MQGQLAERKEHIVANASLVKVANLVKPAIHRGMKHHMLAHATRHLL